MLVQIFHVKLAVCDFQLRNTRMAAGINLDLGGFLKVILGGQDLISGMAPIATAIISRCTLMMISHTKHSFGGALTIRAAIPTSNSVLGMILSCCLN